MADKDEGSGWIMAIVGAAVKGLLNYINLWLTKRENTRLRWKVKTQEGQLKSSAASIKAEKAIARSSEAEIGPVSPSDWNKRVRVPPARDMAPRRRLNGKVGLLALLLVAILALAAGCERHSVFIQARHPVIEAPARPKLSVDPPIWSDREQKLAQYAARLERAVETYNEWARQENAKNGYEDYTGTDVALSQWDREEPAFGQAP